MARLSCAALLAAACSGEGSALTAAPACEVPAEPYRLATLSRCPSHVELDDTHIYWLDGERLMRFPKCGSASPPEKIADTYAFDFAVDGDAVYLPAFEGVARIEKTGGAPTTILPLSQMPERIAAAHGWVYATSEGTCVIGEPCGAQKPMILRVRNGGGDPEVVFSHEGGQVFELVVRDDTVFFVGNLFGFPTVLRRVPASGGASESLVPPDTPVGGSVIDVDDRYVYFDGAGGIRRVLRDGSSPVATLVAEQSDANSLAVDGSYIYFTDGYQTSGRLVRAPADGESQTVLVSGTDPQAVAADQGAIYYGTCLQGDDAAIWILAK